MHRAFDGFASAVATRLSSVSAGLVAASGCYITMETANHAKLAALRPRQV
jgi:hypothetical protein